MKKISLLLITLFMVGCTKPLPKFNVADAVVVLNGFYKDCHGYIESYNANAHPPRVTYYVNLECFNRNDSIIFHLNTSLWVSEKNIRGKNDK